MMVLVKEIGGAKELEIPEETIHTWLKAVRFGKLDSGEGSHTPTYAMSLAEEITMLRKRVKDQDKEIHRLKEENKFLEEASAFFAASRRNSVKTREGCFSLSRQRPAGVKERAHSIAVCLLSAGRDSINILLIKTDHGSIRSGRIWR